MDSSAPQALARAGDTLVRWQRFVDALAPDRVLRDVILASWERSRAAGVDPHATRLVLHRVSESELATRLAASAELLEVARPHLEWLSAAHASIAHVAYVVDRDGIVLSSTGTDHGAMTAAGLLPGYDWSEATMGTNGAGTALIIGAEVLVDGAKHFVPPLHGYACTGAPVRGPDGEVIGAIDLSSGAGEDTTARLPLVAYAAYAIRQELRHRASIRRASGALVTEQRAAAEQASRVAALEALRESEARFQGAFDHSAIAASITNLDGRWLRVNRALCTMLGYSEQELLGLRFQEITHPDDLEPNEELLRRTLAGESDRYRMEKRLYHADGHEVWVLLNAALVRDERGAPMYLVAQFQDVTERRRAESQLRASEERYRRVVETAHEGICTVDGDGVITYANARLSQLLGRAVADLVGRSFCDFLAREVAGDARTRFARPQRGAAEVVELAELAFHRADGGTLWTLMSASCLFDTDGELSGAVYLITDVTERHAVQRRLAESERHFRALTEQSSELVCILDGEARVRYANPAFVRLLGCEPEEALGHSYLRFVHPVDAANVAGLLGALARDPGGVVRAEFGVVRRDGSRHILGAVAQNRLDDAAIAGIVVNAHDVTDRRHAEDALRQSEARHERIAANAPGMVFQFARRADGTMAFPFVSEGVRHIYGLEPADIQCAPERILDLVHPDDRASYDASVAASAATLSPWQWEGRVVLPTGEEKWLRGASRPERQPDGGIVWDGLLMDVSDRRRAARQLEESEQRYRSLFEHHPDAVYSFDLAGHFLSVNPALERLAGMDRETLLGRSFAPLIVAEHLDATLASFRLATNGEATSYTTAIRHPDGRRIDIAVTNVPIIVAGQVVGVYGIAKDLTRQRELEEQLRHASKMEAIGRLAGGVAHDFNNLLTIITSYTAMAVAELPPDVPVHADLGEVQRAADRAAALTRQLLAFSRQQVLQPRVVDTNRTVADVARMLRRVIGEDVALVTELASEMWPVLVDPGQLEQVLMNLAVNARDAMPTGGTLRLRTANHQLTGADATRRWPALAPGPYAAIQVEDTGTGISPELLPRIFEPFFTTKDFGAGTGLGLATVYGIVTQSGGHVDVESTPGRGSRFTILLPRSEVSVAGAERSTKLALPRGTETVLLVEDEGAVRQAVRRMLERLGYTVLEAASGAEALRLAESARAAGRAIDLVLTDVVMPEENGRAVAKRLASVGLAPRLLYMSGYADDEILRRGLRQSAAAFLEKPFTPERLACAVRQALDGGATMPAT